MRAPRNTRSSPGRRWRLVRARRDAMPYSVRRFMQRARQRRMRAALPWAVIGGVVVAALLVGWVLLGTSLLGVRDVRVTGARLLTLPQVRQAAAVPAGTPLAQVDLTAVRRRVAALAPVDRVAVHRDWPRTLVVEITERTAVAVVPQSGKFVLLDGAGVAFHTAVARPDRLPTVKVTRPGQGDPDTQAAVQVLAALTGQLRGELASVSVDGPARIRLALRDGREVIWGDASQSELKARVATALLARDGKTYDVSAPDVVTIR